ncbi:MAG: hypothetical protein ABUT20_27375, partial [Bacteroidota bacterium]
MILQPKYMIGDEIHSAVKSIEKDDKLYQEKNFSLRLQAIDDIEFHVIERIDGLMESNDAPDEIIFLKNYAEKVRNRLENVNIKMFHRLRTEILQSNDKRKFLMDLLNEYLDYNVNIFPQQDANGYDDLDIFLNGLLTNQQLPAETIHTEPEMVFYQKTPARIIFELIKKAAFKPHDVFFDLGSGLGQVTLLVNLLTSV